VESDENDRVENEKVSVKEISSSINASSNWVNRIDYIPHIDWVQMLLCEIPTIVIIFISTGVLAHKPNLHLNNWKGSFRTKRIPTKVAGTSLREWMAQRSSIQIVTPLVLQYICGILPNRAMIHI